MTEARCQANRRRPPEVTREAEGHLVNERPCQGCAGVRSRPENANGPVTVPVADIARQSAEAEERKARIAQGLTYRPKVRLSRTVGTGFYVPRGGGA